MTLSSQHNVVLIGMRGAGKSTLGRQLAQRLGRPFCDLDDELERRQGRDVDALLSEEGEPAFRRLEADELTRAAVRQGEVVATGGGAVLHDGPMRALAVTGPVVFLDTPLEVLVARFAARPRPALTDLDPSAELALLLARRRSFYEAWADISVRADDVVPILAALESWSPSAR